MKMDNSHIQEQPKEPEAGKGFWNKVIDKGVGFYNYLMGGVWSDTRRTWQVNLLKTISLSVKSFFNTDLQVRAAALTFQTVLAIVPALALLFAIGRGFGFQNLLQTQLFNYLPAQKEALQQAFKFVDSYLAQSSEGLFVGIGIAFLLWTLISLISNVEDAFNKIWGLQRGRSIWRKLTDYMAIFLILPVLMICASGITVFMSSTLQSALPFDFMSPVISYLLDFASLVLTWLFFAGTYMLVPNTKVKFKNAFMAGILAGTAFLVLQWLFVSGQIYVTKYNAIYGSFAFLPLLLIWLQLVWLITLAGGVLCYSSQNIFQFSFTNAILNISRDYKWRITLAVLSVVNTRFDRGEKPLPDSVIASSYGLPISLVTDSVNLLVDCGLLQRVVVNNNVETLAVAPAKDPSNLTLADVVEAIGQHGNSGFIPGFAERFASLNSVVSQIREAAKAEASKIPLKQLIVEEMLPKTKHKSSNN